KWLSQLAAVVETIFYNRANSCIIVHWVPPPEGAGFVMLSARFSKNAQYGCAGAYRCLHVQERCAKRGGLAQHFFGEVAWRRGKGKNIFGEEFCGLAGCCAGGMEK